MTVATHNSGQDGMATLESGGGTGGGGLQSCTCALCSLLACLPGHAYSGHVLAISDANSTGRSTG